MRSQPNLCESRRLDCFMTYGWNRVSYNVLRSLAVKGMRVGVSDSSRLGMSLWSKFAAVKLTYNSFYDNTPHFLSWLEKTLLQYKIRVYMPIHEEIFLVAKNVEKLRKTGTVIPISDFETLKNLHLKDRCTALAKRLDIPVPLSIEPKDLADVRHFANHVTFPVVIKMLNSNSAKGVFYCHSLDQLLKRYDVLSKSGTSFQNTILQEYVYGDGYGVSLLMNKGNVRALFTHKRLREKTFTGGTSSKRISVHNKVIEEYALRLLEHVNYHGVAMVEFKYNEKTGNAYFLEVNPRFWGSLALPIRAGVDFPFLLYKIAVEGDVKPVLNYKEGVVVRWILGDVLATISEIRSTKRLIDPIKKLFVWDQDGFDDFYSDDPKPFFFEMLYYFSKFMRTRSMNPADQAIIEVDRL